MKKYITHLFLFLSYNLFASCSGINNNLFSILHEKGTKYSAFTVRVDSTTLTQQYGYKAFVTVIESYSSLDMPKQVEIHSGGNTTAGGRELFQGKYYFILGYEFEKGKFGAFVCDVHSKPLSDSEDSSLIVKKMIHYKKHIEQKYTGKVKYYNDTILIAEGNFRKGIPNGRWKYYDWEGKLLEDIGYKMGNKVGIEKRYYRREIPYWVSITKKSKRYIKNYEYFEETGKKYQSRVQKIDKIGNATIKFMRFHENGKLRQKCTSFQFMNWTLASPYFGVYEEYNVQGKPIAKGTYDNGAKVGQWIEQNPKDSSLVTNLYPAIEKSKNVFTWYNADGTKAAEGRMNKKGKQGFWTIFYENGDTLFCGNYQNNKKQGVWKYFYNGLNSTETYLDDELNGEIIHYYSKSGKISGKGYKKNGQLVGEYKSFYESGTLASITNQNEAGQTHGIAIAYHENGKIAHKEDYINGYINGLYIYYDENGNIIEKGFYDNGLRVGEWLRYDSNGKLKEKCIYPYKPIISWEQNCEYF